MPDPDPALPENSPAVPAPPSAPIEPAAVKPVPAESALVAGEASAVSPEASAAPAPIASSAAPPPPNFEWLPPVIGTVPSTAPAAAAEKPPTPPVIEPSPRPKPVGALLLMATIGSALAVGVLSLLVTRNDPRNTGAPYMIGAVIGGVVFWPAVILGLFSIFRRFRNARSRAIILLCTWTLIALTLLANFRRQSDATTASGDEAAPAKQTADTRSAPATPAPVGAGVAATNPAPPTDDTAPAESAARFDFSSGSDARLIKQIESAQESTYGDVVRGYVAACRQRPKDALLALERVRFIERFAYSEDITFAAAEGDLAAAKQNLLAKFPQAPSTLLYELEQLFGDEFNAKVDVVWPQVGRWSPADRARFWLLRAQRANKDAEAAARFAASAFEAEPSPDAALRHARGLLQKPDAAAARTVLMHPVFNDAPDWQQAQRMELLLEAGANADGIALFEMLATKAPHQVNTSEVADLLAAAGRVDLARRVYAGMPQQKWNAASVARQRFAFEMQHGTGEQAEAAYRALREAGFETDTFARERAALLLKHPAAGWDAMDIGSLFALGFLLVFAALLPLAVLVPAHYWGLWRRARGRAAAWTLSPWGLRSAWLVLATLAVGVMVGLWWFQPATIRAWGDESPVPAPERPLAADELLGPPMMMWTAVTVVLLALLLQARTWRLLGGGEWPWGKSVGLGIGLALLLKICLGVYITVFGFEELGMADVSPLSTQFFGAAYRTLGGVGFFALIAVFVPLFEEVLFRGLLLGALAKHVPFWAANALQSLAFVALHDEMRVAPFFFAVGFVNGELVRRSRGLLPGIVVHVVNNALACIVVIARGGV
jgi:uncharacterized protein